MTTDGTTTTSFPVQRTDAEWREVLDPARYQVLRQAGTERAFSGAYVDTEDAGLYRCAACSNPLFRSETKYHSGSGWPSFYEPLTPGSVVEVSDRSHGMLRTEVMCGACGSHLGHVFADGPQPTGQRYCMNSLALDLDADQPSVEQS
jgi:peptide-methionine (R)-S-oxide reductase